MSFFSPCNCPSSWTSCTELSAYIREFLQLVQLSAYIREFLQLVQLSAYIPESLQPVQLSTCIPECLQPVQLSLFVNQLHWTVGVHPWVSSARATVGVHPPRCCNLNSSRSLRRSTSLDQRTSLLYVIYYYLVRSPSKYFFFYFQGLNLRVFLQHVTRCTLDTNFVCCGCDSVTGASCSRHLHSRYQR